MDTCQVTVLFSVKLNQSFNSLKLDRIFRSPNPLLIVGHEDGIVRTYELPSPDNEILKEVKQKSSFETKGGPIQALLVSDVTKLNSEDLVVGDSRGVITVFSNGQILERKVASEYCILCLEVEKDSTGNFGIVAADASGNLLSFTPHFDLWFLRLADIQQLKGITSRPKVLNLLPVVLNMPHGLTANYLLVTDDASRVCFLQHGNPVLILQAQSNITAMCSGKFVESSEIDSSVNNPSFCNSVFETQVALATEAGAIYIMTNFEIYQDEFANIKLPITHMQTLPAAESQITDTILAAGNFNLLCVLRNGRLVGSHKTTSWVNSLVTSDLNKDGVKEVVIGCRDNVIHGLQLTFI